MEETKKTNHGLESVGRRKAVKKIVGGVTVLAAYNTLPVNWSKPIIEQVFLPAHAQTSGCPGCSLNDPCTITIISGNSSSSEVVVQVEGRLDQPIAGLPATITVTPAGAGIAPPVLSTTTDAQGKFTGTFTITGGPGITAVSAVTQVVGVDPAGCDISTTTTTQAPAPACIEITLENNTIGQDFEFDVNYQYTNCNGVLVPPEDILDSDDDSVNLTVRENTILTVTRLDGPDVPIRLQLPGGGFSTEGNPTTTHIVVAPGTYTVVVGEPS